MVASFERMLSPIQEAKLIFKHLKTFEKLSILNRKKVLHTLFKQH